jgi:hypothetical protein
MLTLFDGGGCVGFINHIVVAGVQRRILALSVGPN